ncbi:serotriflin-like [Arctopsyche grandis]|uniref:serotriflin-like n=1 Tax=Arctopsyche grandis TaxID=121162 RepID=UPI00406D740E
MSKFSYLFISIIISTVLSNSTSQRWRFDRKPRIFGDKIPNKALNPIYSKVMKKIVLYHNFFRSKVEPKASNMLTMKWHEGAAKSAQAWADQCHLLQHDPPHNRFIKNYGNCGQNIFISSHQVPWFFAVKTWFMEHLNFTYGSPHNNLKVVGHYTQMVWATTHEVGCGFTKCPRGGPGGKPFFNYICNYCPTGNWEKKLGKPYKRGKPCSRCSKSCKLGKLCTNACHYADQWSNCRELISYGKSWLCGTNTPDGLSRIEACKATCTCRNKIHEWR